MKKLLYLSPTLYGMVLAVFALMMLVSSCKEEKKPNYNYTKFRELPKEEISKSEITVKEVKNDKKSQLCEDDDGEVREYSFWFVVWEIKDNGGKVNTYVAQPHEGFSMKEFKEHYGEDSFILNLIEISYETYTCDSN